MESRNPLPASAEVARRASVPRVEALMRRDFVAVAETEKLLDAHRTMQLARLRHLLVVDGRGRLLGILSYRHLQDEVLARAEHATSDRWQADLRGLTVRDMMVPTPYYVRPETPVDQAARRMLRLRLGCLPVCENGSSPRLVGILTESDLLRAAWWK